MVWFGEFRLDERAGRLTRGGQEIGLQPRVFNLLCAFVSRAGAVVGRAELTEAVWPDVHVSPNVLDQALRKLRLALGDSAPITAVPGRGWRFEGPVIADIALVGRAEWLANAARRVRLPGQSAWHGPAGIGKTALSHALPLATPAVRVEGPVGDSSAGGGVEAWVWQIAAALGASAVDEERLPLVLRRRGPLTLVLDGAPAALAERTRRWGVAAPELRVVVFSRESWPGSEEVPPLSVQEAEQLLEGVGPAAPALARYSRGIPSVIEALRAAARVISPVALARRLDQGAPMDALHQALEASWNALSDPARELVGLLGAAGRPVELGELERVLPAKDLLSPLAALSAERWIEPSTDPLDGRPGAGWVLSSAARSLAGDRFRSGRDRWRDHWIREVRRVADAAWQMEDDALAAHQAMCRDVALFAAEDAELAVAMGIGCRYVGPWLLARAALESAPRTPRSLALLGEYRLRTGARDTAIAALREAAGSGDVGAEALAALFLARAIPEEAVAREAVDRATRAGAPAFEALAHDALGVTLARMGHETAAAHAFDQALAFASFPGLRRVRGAVLQNRAAAAGLQGDHSQAVRWFSAAIRDLEAVAGPAASAATRMNLGQSLLALKRVREAEAEFAVALEQLAGQGDEANEALAAFRTGISRLILGNREGAREVLAVLGAHGRGARRRADAAILDGLLEVGAGHCLRAEASFAVAAAICRGSADTAGAVEADALVAAAGGLGAEVAHDGVRPEVWEALRVQREFSAPRRPHG